jgi:dolichyl-phosphate beta-glucosyltransferase
MRVRDTGITVAATVIVVPCYNEATRLNAEAMAAGMAALEDVSILFVDDGSTDSTHRILEDLCRADPGSFSLLRLERNAGKAEAVRAGVNEALGAGAEFVGYWDADLATPLDQIGVFRSILVDRPELVAVLGSRVRRLGSNIERNQSRHLLGRLFATAASLVLGLPVYDTQCGAKLFRAVPAVKSSFAEPFLSRWLFDVELLARLVRNLDRDVTTRRVMSLYEQPLPVWRDEPGSKLSLGHKLKVPVELFAIYRRYRDRDLPGPKKFS